jgi:hypothetical protein
MNSKFSSGLISEVSEASLHGALAVTARPQFLQQQPSDDTKSNRGDICKVAMTADQQKVNAARKPPRKFPVQVEAKATVVAGNGNVTKQLTVVPPKS